MAYKVLYTDVALPPGVSQPDFSKLIPLSFDTRDVAVKKACELIKRGAVVWKIEGPNGVEMTRAQIEEACESDNLKPITLREPIVKSTEGITHKQHKDRNVQLPPKRPSR
jgi:hypothetical protein